MHPVAERYFCVVDSVESHFASHVVDGDSLFDGQVCIPNGNEEDMKPFVHLAVYQPRKNAAIMRMKGAVGDPILLSRDGGRVDDELVRGRIERGRRLHLDRVVSVGQLGQAETTNFGECVDFGQNVVVALEGNLSTYAISI